MSENSSVQLSVGSIIHMDAENGVDGSKDIWISQALQFEDIYLTESEDFWQEQELDVDKQLFEGFLFKQSMCGEALSTFKPFDEFLMDVKTPTRDHSPCNAEMLIEEKLPFEVTDELRMIKLVIIDAPASSTGMSSEQKLPSEVADEGSEGMHEVEMIDTPASLTGMLSSEVADEGVYEIEMIDQSPYLTDMQPVGFVVQKVNKTSSTLDIGSMQRSGVENVPQDKPTLQGKLVCLWGIYLGFYILKCEMFPR